MRMAAIMFLFALSLQGCGHKGPLYMPPPEQPASQPPVQGAAPQPAPAAQPLPASQHSPATQP